MGHIKDILTARQEARHQQVRAANDDLLRDNIAWDAVLDTLPLHAQPGRMVTGLPPRITFRNEGDTA